MASPVVGSSIIPSVVAQHAEQAADLWALRRGYTKRPNINLRDLARLDERLEAHLDGLRIAGEAARPVCDDLLPGDAPGQLFARFLWAGSNQDQDELQGLMARCDSVPIAKELASALGWLPWAQAEPLIQPLLQPSSPRQTSPTPSQRLAALTACSLHRRSPGAALRAALFSDDPNLRSRAARTVGELGELDLLPFLTPQLASDDLDCRFWAAWSLALLSRDQQSIDVLKGAVEDTQVSPELALQVRISRMHPVAARAWIQSLLASEIHIRLGILAIGMSGDPQIVPLLFPLMEQEKTARLSGSAFRMFTGQDIKRKYLDRPEPTTTNVSTHQSVLDEDDEEEDDPDRGLGWPDLPKVQKRWKEIEHNFESPGRYLLGVPMDYEALRSPLFEGTQRERISAALHRSLLRPGSILFNWDAPASRQKRALTLS